MICHILLIGINLRFRSKQDLKKSVIKLIHDLHLKEKQNKKKNQKKKKKKKKHHEHHYCRNFMN